MPANASFDQIASTTFKNLEKSIADNVSNHIPFLKYMRLKGAVKTDGGDTIVRPIYSGLSTAQTYSGSDTISLTKPDVISAAEYNWKQTVVPVIIEGIEQARNSGKSKQIDLLSSLKENAELAIEDKVATMLFGDGTGNGGKDMLGLQAIVDTDPTTGTLGGINRATNTFWRNGYNTSVGSAATYLVTSLSTGIREITRGTDAPDLIIMGSTNYGYLENIAWGKAQMQNPKLADLGFQALKFEGIDVIYDAKCPAANVYAVNTRYLKLYIHQNVNFKMGDFVEPANQDILVAKLKLYAQLTTNRAESAYVWAGITA